MPKKPHKGFRELFTVRDDLLRAVCAKAVAFLHGFQGHPLTECFRLATFQSFPHQFALLDEIGLSGKSWSCM